MCVNAETPQFTETFNELTEYTRLIASRQATGETFLRRGGTLQQMHALRAAVQDYTTAIEFEPPMPTDLLALAHDSRSRCRVQLDQADEAIEDSLQAVELMPMRSDFWTSLGHAQFWGQRYEAAHASLTRALELDPEDWWAYGYRGETNVALGRAQDAIYDLSMVIGVSPQASVFMYWWRAKAYLMLNGFREAEADCTTGIQRDRHDWRVWAWRGYARYRLGNLEGALGDFMESLQLSKQAAAYLGRGLVYQEMGVQHAAVDDLVQFVMLKGGNLAALNELADMLTALFAAPVSVSGTW
jgi:tetratricopeptide (TPR) repeat protein